MLFTNRSGVTRHVNTVHRPPPEVQATAPLVALDPLPQAPLSPDSAAPPLSAEDAADPPPFDNSHPGQRAHTEYHPFLNGTCAKPADCL